MWKFSEEVPLPREEEEGKEERRRKEEEGRGPYQGLAFDYNFSSGKSAEERSSDRGVL